MCCKASAPKIECRHDRVLERNNKRENKLNWISTYFLSLSGRNKMNFPRHTQSQKSENETKLSAVPGNGAHLTSFVISTKTTKEGKIRKSCNSSPKAAKKKFFFFQVVSHQTSLSSSALSSIIGVNKNRTRKANVVEIKTYFPCQSSGKMWKLLP